MKLNLGSGDKRIEGFLNVDYSDECNPDIVMDLEKTPWDLPSDTVTHVIMSHALEHLGKTPDSFIAIMKELYRICQDGAVLEITVPHPYHDNFLSDPTHVRPITGTLLSLFDREKNLEWRGLNAANSPLALQCGVDFRIVTTEHHALPEAMADIEAMKEIDPRLPDFFLKYGRNLVHEMYFKLTVVK